MVNGIACYYGGSESGCALHASVRIAQATIFFVAPAACKRPYSGAVVSSNASIIASSIRHERARNSAKYVELSITMALSHASQPSTADFILILSDRMDSKYDSSRHYKIHMQKEIRVLVLRSIT